MVTLLWYNIDMRRESDTGIVRNYCQNNVGGVFDLNYLSKHNFSDMQVLLDNVQIGLGR